MHNRMRFGIYRYLKKFNLANRYLVKVSGNYDKFVIYDWVIYDGIERTFKGENLNINIFNSLFIYDEKLTELYDIKNIIE